MLRLLFVFLAFAFGSSVANAQSTSELNALMVKLGANPTRAAPLIATALDDALAETPDCKIRCAVLSTAITIFKSGDGSLNTAALWAMLGDHANTWSKYPAYMKAVYQVVKPGLVPIAIEHNHRFGEDFSRAFAVPFMLDIGKASVKAMSCRNMSGLPVGEPEEGCAEAEKALLGHFSRSEADTTRDEKFVPWNVIYLTAFLYRRHEKGGMAAVKMFQELGADLMKSAKSN